MRIYISTKYNCILDAVDVMKVNISDDLVVSDRAGIAAKEYCAIRGAYPFYVCDFCSALTETTTGGPPFPGFASSAKRHALR